MRVRQWLRGWLRDRPSNVVSLFVYVVVLNLAVEHVPGVVGERVTLSLLTALLLKVALEVVITVKNRILTRLHPPRPGLPGRGRGVAVASRGQAASSSSSSWWTSSSATA